MAPLFLVRLFPKVGTWNRWIGKILSWSNLPHISQRKRVTERGDGHGGHVL